MHGKQNVIENIINIYYLLLLYYKKYYEYFICIIQMCTYLFNKSLHIHIERIYNLSLPKLILCCVEWVSKHCVVYYNT